MTELLIIAVLGTLMIMVYALWPLRACQKRWYIGMGVVLMACIGFAYWGFGGWRAYFAHTHAMAQQAKTRAMLAKIGDVQTVIHRLKAHLEAHPKAAKGWYLLGRLYAQHNQWDLAAQAFARAYQLRPEDQRYVVNYAQSLFAKGDPADAKQARRLLETLLAQHPKQADALGLLAMDAFDHRAYAEAIGYWQQLLTRLPQDSDEANAIRRAIARAENKRNKSD